MYKMRKNFYNWQFDWEGSHLKSNGGVQKVNLEIDSNF